MDKDIQKCYEGGSYSVVNSIISGIKSIKTCVLYFNSALGLHWYKNVYGFIHILEIAMNGKGSYQILDKVLTAENILCRTGVLYGTSHSETSYEECRVVISSWVGKDLRKVLRF